MTYLAFQLLDALFQCGDPLFQRLHVRARHVAARRGGRRFGQMLFDALSRTLDGPAEEVRIARIAPAGLAGEAHHERSVLARGQVG